MGNRWLLQHGLWGWAVGVLFAYTVLWGVHDDHPELFQGPVGKALFAPARTLHLPHATHQPSTHAKGGRPRRADTSGGSGRGEIPARYLALYKQGTAECPGLHWTVLAGIGKVESDHGRSSAPGVHAGENHAGAGGPMQFLAPTWAQYGRGGDRYDPADAIPAAARLLCANGAPGDLHQAVYAYNHSEQYVADVLATARRYRG